MVRQSRTIITLLFAILFIASISTACTHRSKKEDPSSNIFYYSDSVLVVNGNQIVGKVSYDTGSFIDGVIRGKEYRSFKERRAIWLLFIVSVLITIALFILYAILKKRLITNLNLRLEEKDDTLDKMQDNLTRLNDKSKSLSETLEYILKSNIGTIKKLSETQQSLSSEVDSEFYPDRLEERQRRVDNLSLSMERLPKRVPLQASLEETLDSTKDGIMRKARNVFGKTMRESDYQVLSGIFAGLNAKEISFLTGISHGTIRTRKSRLKATIKALPDSSDRTLFLEYFKG